MIEELVKAEKAINAIWPSVSMHFDAKHRLEARKNDCENSKKNYMPGVWMLRICIPATVVLLLIFFLAPQHRTIFGDYQRGTVAVMAAMFAFLTGVGILVGLVLVSMYGSKIKKAKKDIAELEKLVEETNAQLEQVKLQNIDGLECAVKLIPQTAFDPKHVRILVNYVETGRAKTLQEAYTLLDEQIHRENMEQLAKDQIVASERVAEAVRRAGYRT